MNRFLSTFIISFLLLIHTGLAADNCQNYFLNLGTNNLKSFPIKTPVVFAAEEMGSYKSFYLKDDPLPKNSNREFMKSMKEDAVSKSSNTIYFDVENSIQKKLNDEVFSEKSMVDAVNNSFIKKLRKNLNDFPELSARLDGQYKDYKSLRLRLSLKKGDDPQKYKKMLEVLYIKTNKEFVDEFVAMGLSKIISPRTDEVVDVSRWFLAGTGDSAGEANAIARLARSKSGHGIIHFADHVDELFSNLNEIELVRLDLMKNNLLVEKGLMLKSPEGEYILSKDMISILRKNKSDAMVKDKYIALIKSKIKTIFGTETDDASIELMTKYFQKVDSISPPLFSRERTIINYGDAKHGLVSVDFSGVGVDNIFAQMRALSSTKVTSNANAKTLKESFSKMQKYVDGVTDDINNSKRLFTDSIKENGHSKNSPQFTGDDGIFMPDLKEWGFAEKKNLLNYLSKIDDPSKYRVTFVRTEYASGKSIPEGERTKLIGEAESVEKKLRDAITGSAKINSIEGRKIVFAIDYIPAENGGTFNLLIGGKQNTTEEKKLIEEEFQTIVKSKNSSVVGSITHL